MRHTVAHTTSTAQRDRHRQVVGLTPQRLQRLARFRVGKSQGQVRQRRLDEEHPDRRNQHRDNENAVSGQRLGRTGHELHDGIQQHVDRCHKGDATEQFRRRRPSAGERAAILTGQQAVLDRRQEKSEKGVHQCDAGQRLVLDLVRSARFAVAAAPITAVQHEVDDDEREAGEDAGQLRVAPRHDRYVEAGPQHAGVGNLSRRHRRNGSCTGRVNRARHGPRINLRVTGRQPEPSIVRVDIREHPTRLSCPHRLRRLRRCRAAAPSRRC